MKIKPVLTAITFAVSAPVFAAPICELPWNAGTEECRNWRNHVGDNVNKVAGSNSRSLYLVTLFNRSSNDFSAS
jgi:hypothetical protein